MGSGQRHAPSALHPGKSRYPLYRRLGGTQGRPGEVRKVFPPSKFDPRTVQPVASRHTDWATPARNSDRQENKIYFSCDKRHCLVYILHKSLPIKVAHFTKLSSSAQSVSVRRRARLPAPGVLHCRDVGSTDYCTCSDVITLHCWSTVSIFVSCWKR
jgi:hypothetical protein